MSLFSGFMYAYMNNVQRSIIYQTLLLKKKATHSLDSHEK